MAKRLKPLFLLINLILGVWGPHAAVQIEVNAKAQSVEASAQRYPQALPLDEFRKIWKKKRHEELIRAWNECWG